MNVVVARTSHQMLKVLSRCSREIAERLSKKITVLTLLVTKSTMELSGLSIFFFFFFEYEKKTLK